MQRDFIPKEIDKLQEQSGRSLDFVCTVMRESTLRLRRRRLVKAHSFILHKSIQICFMPSRLSQFDFGPLDARSSNCTTHKKMRDEMPVGKIASGPQRGSTDATPMSVADVARNAAHTNKISLQPIGKRRHSSTPTGSDVRVLRRGSHKASHSEGSGAQDTKQTHSPPHVAVQHGDGTEYRAGVSTQRN